MNYLSGKVVLVTGAGRGFGWGIAKAMGLSGAKLCITDINKEELAVAEADLLEAGIDVFKMILDVQDLKRFHEVIEKVLKTWGRIDTLVHNAIYMPLTLFEDLTPDDWWKQIGVGLGGLFNGVKACWEPMKNQGGGHIIGIASGSSTKGFIKEVPYCTIKHGQEGFVKALSLEASSFNIAINTMGPGKIIKPTRISWQDLKNISDVEKEKWFDPVKLGDGFVWLASQPSSRFSGYRFDAGLIYDTIQKEGFDFEFTPEKVTFYPNYFYDARTWYEEYLNNPEKYQ